MFKISTGPELAHQPMAISPSLSSRKKKIFTLLHTFIRLVELCLIKNTYIHPVSFFLIICESFLTFILRKKFSSKISSSLKYYFFFVLDQERRYSDFVVRELKMSVEGGKSRMIHQHHYLQETCPHQQDGQ